MKRYLILLLLTGCSLIHEPSIGLEQFSNIPHSDTLKPSYGFADSNPRLLMMVFISFNVVFKKDVSGIVQNPSETLFLGTGDCEDFAILYIDLMALWFGIECNLILVSTDNDTINHAVVELPDGTLINAENSQVVYYKVEHRIEYDNLFLEDGN